MKKVGLKHNYLKKRNRLNILKLIFEKGKVCRKEIASLLGLSPATVSNLVNEMIKAKLVIEVGHDQNHDIVKGGPNPILLSINTKEYYIITVHIGASYASVALMSLYGEQLDNNDIVIKERYPGEQYSENEIYDLIMDCINKLCKKNNLVFHYNILAIGVGVAGTVLNNGSTVWHVREDLRNVLSKQSFEKRAGLPVFFDSIINSYALAEYWFGEGSRYNNYLFVFVGRVLGSAIMVNGKILKGTRNISSLIGHAVVEPNGPECICGKKGCLDVVASEIAIEREARKIIATKDECYSEYNRDRTFFDRIVKEARNGNETYMQLFKRRGNYIGKAIAEIINLVDFEAIILSYLNIKEEWQEMQNAYQTYSYQIDGMIGSLPKITSSTFNKVEQLCMVPAAIVVDRMFSDLEIRENAASELRAVLK